MSESDSDHNHHKDIKKEPNDINSDVNSIDVSIDSSVSNELRKRILTESSTQKAQGIQVEPIPLSQNESIDLVGRLSNEKNSDISESEDEQNGKDSIINDDFESKECELSSGQSGSNLLNSCLSSSSANVSKEFVSSGNVRVFRGIKTNSSNSIIRPSFIVRQFRTFKNFFLELFEFVFLFLTTLFNPMADVNVQVQEYNNKKLAREGKFYSANKPSRGSSFPGCGPSS